MSFYGKIYNYQKQENYEKFIDAIGLAEEEKASLLKNKINQKFDKNGDGYIHTFYVNGAEVPLSFKVGEEFASNIETSEAKNLYTIEGNTVTHVMKLGPNAELICTTKKEFDGDKLVETLSCNVHDVTAKRYFSA